MCKRLDFNTYEFAPTQDADLGAFPTELQSHKIALHAAPNKRICLHLFELRARTSHRVSGSNNSLTNQSHLIRKGDSMPSALGTDPETRPEAVARPWHTVFILALFAIASIASTYQKGFPNANLPGVSRALSGYFTVIALEWFAVGLIWFALKRRGFSVGDLISGGWHSIGNFFRDVGLGVGFMVVVIALQVPFQHIFKTGPDSNVANIIPRSLIELVAWLLLSATAGFCEELIFRGYLTRQFCAWTGSAALANILQAIAFGLSHGYYLNAVMIFIMIHGWALGLLSGWRKSLRPAMVAHGLRDSLGGTVAFFFRS